MVVMGKDEILEEVIQIYYNPQSNSFTDEGGYEILNIHSIISPNTVYLLMYKKDDMFVYGIHGQYIELIYDDYDNLIYGDSDLPIDRY